MAPRRKNPGTKDQFLAELGHGPADHRAWDGSAEDQPRVLAANKRRDLETARVDVLLLAGPRVPASLPKTSGTSDPCNWCSNQDRPWDDLRAAVRELRKHGLNPNGYQEAQLAYEYLLTKGWVNSSPGFEDLRRRLSQPAEGPADGFRIEFLDRLDQFANHARHFKREPESPETGRGRRFVSHAMKHVLERGRQQGWPYQAVAAILLLFGVERGSWKSLRDVVRHANSPPTKARKRKRRLNKKARTQQRPRRKTSRKQSTPRGNYVRAKRKQRTKSPI